MSSNPPYRMLSTSCRIKPSIWELSDTCWIVPLFRGQSRQRSAGCACFRQFKVGITYSFVMNNPVVTKSPRLLDQARQSPRLKHFSPKTRLGYTTVFNKRWWGVYSSLDAYAWAQETIAGEWVIPKMKYLYSFAVWVGWQNHYRHQQRRWPLNSRSGYIITSTSAIIRSNLALKYSSLAILYSFLSKGCEICRAIYTIYRTRRIWVSCEDGKQAFFSKES
jgi:hypothetical protein